ncbi:hypothetical protein BKA70DRAFT_1491669 [Coprinopsis sp. MPI-PUGE-AT-0042]|nr:hypothetical protein BKA70DRAFT_1491669 [Coprinopsis sp. MPI-PUGE-AT-0042]
MHVIAMATAISVAFLTGGTRGYALIAPRQAIIPDNLLSFAPIQNITTCQLNGFNWFFSGSPRSSPLTLVASNGGVPQAKANAYPGVVSRTIFSNVSAGVSGLDWQVDLPPGTYRLEAFVPSLNIRNQSAPFEVDAGSDLSCVPELNLSANPSSMASPTTTFSSSTAGNVESTQTSPGVMGGGSNSGARSGATAGIALGSIIVVATLLAAAFFLIRRRKASKSGGGLRGRMVAVPYFAATPVASEQPPPPYDPSPRSGIDPWNVVPNYEASHEASSSGLSPSTLKAREASSSHATTFTSDSDSLRRKPTLSLSTGEPPIPLTSRHPPSPTLVSSSPAHSANLTQEERNDMLRGFEVLHPTDASVPTEREKR